MNNKTLSTLTTLAYTILLCLSFCSCNDNNKREAEIINCVQNIYKDVADQYNNLFLSDSCIILNLDSLYCSTSWNNLIKEVEKKDSESEEEMGFFDFDYWIMGQDLSNFKIENIKVEECNSNSAKTTIDILNCGVKYKVFLHLIFENNTWKIDNFIDLSNGTNLKKAMQDYLNE